MVSVRTDLEREYLEDYHPNDERVPRMRQLPDSRLVPVKDTYTAEELKTSPTFNEILFRNNHQNGLTVRLDGLDGSHISWGTADPVTRRDWESSQITMIRRLLPHIRQFVRIRQTLVRAKALETTATALLENRRIGVVHLDRRGKILETNDRARHILRNGYGLSDRDGVLRALVPVDQLRLQRLVADALPTDGTVSVSGSMPLRRSFVMPPLVVHVKPVSVPQPDYGGRHVAALVLLVEPGHRSRIDPGLVAETLGLTPGGEPGGGVVGGRQECGRNGPGNGPHQKRHLLAPATGLPENPHLPAGGPRPTRAVGCRPGLIAV